MAVNYDKLWSLLIQKGMTKTGMCEATGITTNTLAKMGKNKSIQVEVLGKICVVLGCKLDDIVDFDGKCEKYIPVPNINLIELNSWDEYVTLGYKQLYDFPHPVSRKSIQSHLTKCLKSCKLTQAACDELLSKLEEKGVIIKLSRNIVPDCSLLPHKFSNLESLDDLEHIQIQNYLSWAIDKKLSDCVDLASIENDTQGKDFLIQCADFTKKEYRFREFKQLEANVGNIYPQNLMQSVFGEERCEILECHIDDLKERVNEVLDTLPQKEELVLRLIYQKGYTLEMICSFFSLPSLETITESIAYIKHRALRRLRHPSRLKKIKDLVLISYPSKHHNKRATHPKYIETLTESVELPPEIKKIEELNFSQRTCNILTHAGIGTLGELGGYSFQSLMEIPKMGKKSLEEIIAKLQEYGITIIEDS